MEVSGQLHTPAALPVVKEHPVSIGEEAWWAQRGSLHGVEENSQLLPEIEPQNSHRPACSLGAGSINGGKFIH
jgi:hypothetical protein